MTRMTLTPASIVGNFVLLVVTMFLAVPLGAMAHGALDMGQHVGSVSSAPTEEQEDSDRARVLAKQHDCWSGAAPADVTIPGHVVTTTAAGRTVYSVRLVGPALEQIFEGKDAGLTVHAFCR